MCVISDHCNGQVDVHLIKFHSRPHQICETWFWILKQCSLVFQELSNSESLSVRILVSIDKHLAQFTKKNLFQTIIVS